LRINTQGFVPFGVDPTCLDGANGYASQEADPMAGQSIHARALFLQGKILGQRSGDTIEGLMEDATSQAGHG